MRLVNADVLRERVQDYFNTLKNTAPLEPAEREILEIINRAMLDIIDTTPTNYVHGKGY